MPGGKAPLVREKNSVAYMHPRTLANLKSPEQVATKLFLTPERLMQLADAELAPHYRIDGGEPKFSLSEIRDWVLEHLVTREDGRRHRYKFGNRR